MTHPHETWDTQDDIIDLLFKRVKGFSSIWDDIDAVDKADICQKIESRILVLLQRNQEEMIDKLSEYKKSEQYTIHTRDYISMTTTGLQEIENKGFNRGLDTAIAIVKGKSI